MCKLNVLCICRYGALSLRIILQATNETIITHVAFFFYASLQVFNYCYIGTLLTTSSSNLVNEVYSFEWYKMDKRVRLCVLMMMTQAQRECGIDFIFFQTSLSSFAAVRYLAVSGNYSELTY